MNIFEAVASKGHFRRDDDPFNPGYYVGIQPDSNYPERGLDLIGDDGCCYHLSYADFIADNWELKPKAQTPQEF